MLSHFPEMVDWRETYPKVGEWDRKLNARPSVVKCVAQREAAIKEGNATVN